MASHPISERTLSRIWQDRLFRGEMRTTTGEHVEVIYGGVWTHADGPDFRDALVAVGGRLLRGAVELHLRASDWLRHGHARNPRYDEVVLHVVLEDDLGAPVAGPSGSPVPTVLLVSYLSAPLEQLLGRAFAADLGMLGVGTCLPTMAGGRATLVHDVLRQAGWRRLAEKQLRFAQELELLPPAEALYRGLLDALGYTRNRSGMAALAERVPLAVLEAASRATPHGATGLLLGTAGFLPLSPAHTELVGCAGREIEELEAAFMELAPTWAIEALSSTVWTLNRVRPHNHPVRRLASLGSLIERADPAGLLDTVLGLPLDAGASWRRWLESAVPSIGRSRCDQIAVNVLAPFLAAYADVTGDEDLADRAGLLWEALPGRADDAVAKATLRQIVGGGRFPITSAIESQGLHQIGRHGCANLRCFECPIAVLALQYEAGHLQVTDVPPGDG